MTKHLKAIGYLRVSSDSQGDTGYSMGDQVAAIERFCADKGIELLALFREVESAATTQGRPVFKAAVRRVYHDDADCLVVTNLDRFSRDTLGAEIISRAFKARGKQLLSVQESYLTPILRIAGGTDYDDDQQDYLDAAKQHRFIEAEQERKRIAKRCKRGKARKALQGGWTGHRPPYEYDVVQGELVLNPERGLIVRHIVRLRKLKNTDGKPWSYKQIAAYLDGANDLIDPETGLPGRRFPSYGDRVSLRKRNTPKINSPLWNWATVRRISLQIANGERQRWIAEKSLGTAS